MKGVLSRSVLILLAGMSLVGMALNDAVAQCVPFPAPDNGYRIYYHNSGLYDYCVQDNDMDLAEYIGFLSQFSNYISQDYGTPLTADTFVGCPDIDEEPHGYVVQMYFEYAYCRPVPDFVEMTQFTSWCDMVDYIANNYGRGTVVNLSNGTLGWEKACTAPVESAYAAEVLLVGAPLTFAGAPDGLADKVLRCWFMDGTGEFVAGLTPNPPNVAAVGVPTNWRSSQYDYFIATPRTGQGWSPAWKGEGGSFSTPLLAGTVQRIADAVLTRGLPQGEFVPKVLDYVISACDRNVDPETYQHRLNEPVTSFGPWSPIWGYGVFSPWKALIYAYGFGKLEPVDSQMDPGVADPPTVFSDHFFLRGDLFVPAGQTFRVSPLATVSVDPGVSEPEGPTNLGLFAELQEIRVAGNMDVETSLNVPSSLVKGVNATVVVDSGGSCTVKDGGTITIGSGQKLYVCAGGELNVETGGEIVVSPGGSLEVHGEFNHAGTLALSSGSQTTFGSTAEVFLQADLNIPAGASWLADAGGVITVASTDAAGAGSDPNRVEITCSGVMTLSGDSQSPVTIQGQSAGAGQWVGIVFDSGEQSGSSLNYVQISDSEVGVAIAGSAPLTVSNLTVVNCETGVQVTGRSDITLNATGPNQGIYNCTNGVKLSQASVDIYGASIHHNNVGIHCTQSSPKVRNCDIYANDNGVMTFDPNSIPDLGTVADPGNNDFCGPPGNHRPCQLNDFHIVAMDPSTDIYAQKNWWGTTRVREIRSRIIVIAQSPDAGQVIFQPFLTGPPLPLAGEGLAELLESNEQVAAPTTYLTQNYPNPFNPVTTIHFGLERPSRVSLRIYNAAGQLVRVLMDARLDAGHYEEPWNGTDSNGHPVTTGVYFYSLVTESFTETRKMVLVR